MFHGDSINSIASFQYIAEEARSPLRPWLMELWGKAHTSCRLGRQPCSAVPVEEARPGVEAGSFGPTSLRAVSHFILWIRQETQLDPMGRIRARGWQRSILNEFVSWSSFLGSAGESPMPTVLGYTLECFSCSLHTADVAGPGSSLSCLLLEALAQPFTSILLDRQVSASPFSCPLVCGVALGWWVHSLSPCPLGSPLTWHEHGQVTLLWLER